MLEEMMDQKIENFVLKDEFQVDLPEVKEDYILLKAFLKTTCIKGIGLLWRVRYKYWFSKYI